MEEHNFRVLVMFIVTIPMEVRTAIVRSGTGSQRAERLPDDLEQMVRAAIAASGRKDIEAGTEETLQAVRAAQAAYLRAVALLGATDLPYREPVRMCAAIAHAMAMTLTDQETMTSFIATAYPRLRTSIRGSNTSQQAYSLTDCLGSDGMKTLIRNIFAADPGSRALLSYLAANLFPTEKRKILDWLKALAPDELEELIKTSSSETVRRRLTGKPVNTGTAARVLELALEDDENGGDAIAELYNRCPSGIKVR